jgi:hypothetical protein
MNQKQTTRTSSGMAITDAVAFQAPDDPTLVQWLPWRIGRNGLGRWIRTESAGEFFVGEMVTATVADDVVKAHNAALREVQI